MKTMSVLLSFTLLLAANQLASRLKRAGALPADRHPAHQVSPDPAKGRTMGLTTFKTPLVKRKKA